MNRIGGESTLAADAGCSIRFKNGSGKSKFFNNVFGYQGIIRKVAGAIIPKQTFNRIKKSSAAQKMVTKIRDKNLARPQFDPELKKQITQIYQEDIRQLSKLIGRDLDHWLK